MKRLPLVSARAYILVARKFRDIILACADLSALSSVATCRDPVVLTLWVRMWRQAATNQSADRSAHSKAGPPVVLTKHMTIEGYATLEGTTRYRERFRDQAAPNHFREQQELLLSSVGIGTYLGNADDETDGRYTAAVMRAVELGANVIDTAANYRFQRSERAIGKALLELTEHGGFSRDELVICTKGGYLPFDGAPPRDLRRYLEETFVKPGIADLEDFVGGSHCMTPRYLQNQLQQSLGNMKLDCVDVYYIHNPESQLGHVSEAEFYTRVRAAFESLEQSRAQGQLKFYGVATWNGFRVPTGESGYHSLARLTAIARELGGEAHGLRFIQLPFNLAMPEALTLRNQTVDGSELSTLEAAAELGVTVISSASIFQGRVARGLPQDLREGLGSLPTDAQTAIQFVRSAPGIATALVGMSNPEHVEENLKLVDVEPLPPEQFMTLFSEG
jgi:aryl-alcohol dehydrogenase-like predicted oxidoreductase